MSRPSIEVEAGRLRSFARAVDSVLADQEFLRESFHLAVTISSSISAGICRRRSGCVSGRREGLQSEDWAEIDARLDDRKDPLFEA